MRWGGGLYSTPLYAGHSPPRIRNRELLPQPLGPVMSRCMPSSTCGDSGAAWGPAEVGPRCPPSSRLWPHSGTCPGC